jgi:NaMN:DMB phosphoribosyltransferase
MDAARQRQSQLTKPAGSLGMLEELAIFMAGWQGREKPVLDRAQALVFAGNHGVCAQGVNPFPQEVTVQMVANFQHGARPSTSSAPPMAASFPSSRSSSTARPATSARARR